VIHKIKALYDDGRGLEIRAIARELGISRNTVKKYLRTDEAQIHQQQSQRTRAKRMDAHREYIIHLLTTFPRLSAVKVLRKLKEKFPALAVSDRSARRYIRALKETVASSRNATMNRYWKWCPVCNARWMGANCGG